MLAIALAALVASAAAGNIPANTAAPTVTGATGQGATLTATDGTWTGTAPISYTVQWQRCDTSGSNCVDIGGATGTTRVASSDDVGHTLRVRVVATNSSGQATAFSNASDTILSTSGDNPVNTALPTIVGSLSVGSTVTVSPGAWSGTPTPTFTYVWEDCDATGASCQTIPLATSSSYVVSSYDVSYTLRVVVTATNSSGSGTATSTQTAVISLTGGSGVGPVETSAPSISGTASVGSTLTAQTGTWNGTAPLSYTYQWQRCNATGASCTAIAGATAHTYLVASADSGSTLSVKVTVTDAGGSTSDSSFPTAVVGGKSSGGGGGGGGTLPPTPSGPSGPPQVVDAPVVSGLLLVGTRLTTSEGSWESVPGIAFADAWLRCDATGANCQPIPKTDGLVYRITRADLGHSFRSQVTTTNASGSTPATSNATGPVLAGKLTRVGRRLSAPATALADPTALRIAAVHLAAKRPLAVRVLVDDGHRHVLRGALVTAGGTRTAATSANGWALVALPSSALKGRTLTVTLRARATATAPVTTRRVRLRVKR